jgi:glycosyltransferase involved in cell wall biosynthesis
VGKLGRYYSSRIKAACRTISEGLPPLKDKPVAIYNPPPPVASIRKELAETPTFLYLGGESYVKGFYVLMQAIEIALREGVKARFMFTNKYSNQAQLIISRINRSYSNVIHLTGRIPYTEVLNLYRQAWASLFPSIYEEPLPYVPIEFILLQTMPIASKVGGVPELLNPLVMGKHLVGPGDIKTFQEHITMFSSMRKGELHDQIVYLNDISKHLLNKLLESSKSLVHIILENEIT